MLETIHYQFIPSSLLGYIACAVLYDNHPRHRRNPIDIIVCTNTGELIEFYRRDIVSSLKLNCITTPVELKILRNNESDLFYLMNSEDELFIVSSNTTLQLHKIINNVHSYEFEDPGCTGQACLKVIRKDDAVPIYLDNNFDSSEGRAVIFTCENDDTSPLLEQLHRKLVEAKYTTNCNEKIYKEYVELRQKVAFSANQNLQPNSEDTKFTASRNSMGSFKFKTLKPWVRVCNKKMIIVLSVLNTYKEPVENIQMFLESAGILSLVYTTKLFVKTPNPPYWCESTTKKLEAKEMAKGLAFTAVIDLDELKVTATSRIRFTCTGSYTIQGKDYLQSFEDVFLSSSESMNDSLDVFSDEGTCFNDTLLAIIATSEKTDLQFICKKTAELRVSFMELLCRYLKMERIGANDKPDHMIVYKKSPYHILNGVMIVFPDGETGETSAAVTVYTRSTDQVLALIHTIYDTVPAQLIITTPHTKVTAINESPTYSDDVNSPPIKILDHQHYARSILNRTTKILEYLNESMAKMYESKDADVLSKIGTHIDVFAGGVENFNEFRNNLNNEAKNGIRYVPRNPNDSIECNYERIDL